MGALLYKIFLDADMVAAKIDRLAFQSYVLDINGET